MKSRVVLIQTAEGFAAFCPALPGCVAQGETEAVALDQIREAIVLWLDSGGTLASDGGKVAEEELLREAAEDGSPVQVREVCLAVVA